MKKLPGFARIRPPKPTRRTPHVAAQIAARLLETLNLDEVYWTGSELEDCQWQTEQEIIAGAAVDGSLIRKLRRKYPLPTPWQTWPEEIEDHADAVGPTIRKQCVDEAVAKWIERHVE